MSCCKATYLTAIAPSIKVISLFLEQVSTLFLIGVAPIMTMQLSTARKLMLKVRMFLQKHGITLLEGTRTICEGGLPEPKTASAGGLKTARPFVGG